MIQPLKPIFTFSEIYGPGHVYISRAHRATCQWFTRDPATLDSYTGNQFGVAGQMPIVCSAGVAAPSVLDLLAEAGLSPPTSLHVYRDDVQAVQITADLAQRGHKLVVQHIFPPGVLPQNAMWIEPRLLSYLNNKANLPDLVPAQYIPPRKLSTYSMVFDSDAIDPPVVLKVATDHSSGCGVALALCRSKADLAEAAARFNGSAQLIVEKFLNIRQDLCLNYVVLTDGSSQYLGYSDQDISDKGEYHGNWIPLGAETTQSNIDLGLQITRRAATMGYRGIVGIDMAVLLDGSVTVLDLNFRVNGSTAAILLRPAIYRAKGAGMMHLRTFTSTESFDQMIAKSCAAVRDGKLIPVGAFDPRAAGYPQELPRLRALVLGESQSDILNIETHLAASGLM